MRRIRLLLFVAALGLLVGCTNNLKDGLTLLQEEKYEDAIVSFEKEISEEKNLSEAYRGTGIAYFELEDYESAITAFEAALEHEAEETARIYHMLGTSALKLDQYEEALTYYGKVLEMKDCTDEMRQEALFNEIAIYQLQSDWETLKEKVDAYVAAYPEDTRMDKTVEFLETR